MANDDSEDELSDMEFEIATACVRLGIEHARKYYIKCPKCTSILSGRSYVQEVLEGHVDNCYDMFRMDVHIFRHLCSELQRLHLLEEDRGIVSVEESVALLCYILGHNTNFRLIANRFQHSLETGQRRFRRALRAVHELRRLILRPDEDASELPAALRGNIKYYPWFKNCVGAIDGTHVSASAPTRTAEPFINRHTEKTQNMLCTCNFDMRFTYVHAGWEGSTHDSKILTKALGNEGFQFPWPPAGSYYLVDSGFSMGSVFLPPHKNVRYHSKEFRGPQREPNTAQELFNYRHSLLRMVIERTFGV